MRIVSWNCNMGYAAKREEILALDPDLVVLQECSERHIGESGAPFAHWVGTNPHKGLGVLGFGGHAFALGDAYTPDYPWFLPVRVEDEDLCILAVWASVKERRERYVRITHRAIDHYQAFLEAERTVAIGDFNSNTIWDGEHGEHSHSALVEKLARLQMRSVYHAQTQESQGEETVPTFYMYRHRDKGYHIDYAFVSHGLLEGSALTILEPEPWLRRSDHLPLVLDVDVVAQP